MEVVATLPADTHLRNVGAWVQRAESLGFDTVHVPETIRDPFSTCALAIEHSERVSIRTSMVVAFPRSPMTTAYAAWELAEFSEGRFELGLASQVRGNIVGRYGGTWSDPTGRLRDYVISLRAIFQAFQDGTGLDVSTEHYTFTRLQPYFNPGPLHVSPPPIYLGAVNEAMVRMAGEFADGLVCHPTSSHPVTLSGQSLPWLTQGADRAGRARPRVVVGPKPIVADSASDLANKVASARQELAFLYATPAYRGQLEALGLGQIGDELSLRAHAQRWHDLDELLSDDVIELLVPVGTWADIGERLLGDYANLADGIVLPLPDDVPADKLRQLVTQLR